MQCRSFHAMRVWFTIGETNKRDASRTQRQGRMKYGYAVHDNDLSMQLKALREFGCDEIQFDSDMSGLIGQLKDGDILAVWRLDKLASSVALLEQIFEDVHCVGASVELLFEGLNSDSDYKEILSQLIGIMRDIENI